MKTSFLPRLVGIGLAVLGCITASFSQETVSLAELEKKLMQQNPEVRAAQKKSDVLRHEADTTAWPNPTFGYIDEQDPPGETDGELMRRRHYNVQQMIPFPGKTSGERRMKEHEAMVGNETLARVQLERRRDLIWAYAGLARAQRMEALAHENHNAMRSMLKAAQARLAAGKTTAVEALLLESEVGRLENEVLTAAQERRQKEYELNTLLAEPVEKTWPAIDFPAKPATVAALPDLLARARRENPLLRSMEHEQRHARAMQRRNRLELAPDIGLMYEYQTAGDGSGGEGPAGRQLGVSLSVPLWLNRPSALLKVARAHNEEVLAETETMRRMVEEKVAMAHSETTLHLNLVDGFEKRIIPAARAAWDSARQQVAAGRMDFMRLLDVNHEWLRAHEDYIDEIYHVAEHAAELELWVGGKLP